MPYRPDAPQHERGATVPLSPPSPREKLHTRAIVIDGYRREDGLFDIEAQLADTKTYAFSTEDRGEVTPGVPLHGMLIRLTIDEDMTVVAAEANTEYGPFAMCPAITPNFARLAGLRIGPGWTRKVKEVVGGVQGCTHLVELLGPMATVAFQTLIVVRRKRPADPAAPPALLNTCHAYAADSPMVARRWPEYVKARGYSAGPDMKAATAVRSADPLPDDRE
ncbi:DUF2889 domain-containing protein [Elioraea sp.]|uniref:DUF2889 domain-containing protein n=1 Tax=Elioraea sp. TaxID=2185103 RepID=UPI0034592604